MARRDDRPTPTEATRTDPSIPFAGIGTRYDLLLAAIPLAFVAAFGIGAVFDVPSRTVVVGAAVVGIAALLDGLFLNPPGRVDGT